MRTEDWGSEIWILDCGFWIHLIADPLDCGLQIADCGLEVQIASGMRIALKELSLWDFGLRKKVVTDED